jgi:hypothetical protein
MEPATYAEVLYFTRYLCAPTVWHPDGCLYELFTPGAMVWYRGFKAIVLRQLLNGWITIKYVDKYPYDMPAGMVVYEDVHVETALGKLELYEADSEWLVTWQNMEPSMTENESNEDYLRGPAAEWDVGDLVPST